MRHRSVFVRPLAVEGQRLKRLSRQAKHASTSSGRRILLASATEMRAREIAELWLTDGSHARRVIHDFNAHGFDSLRPRFRGGRPRTRPEWWHRTTGLFLRAPARARI